MTRKPGTLAPDSPAVALIRLLAPLEIGDEIMYADLSAAIGADVQGEARPALERARNRLLRDERKVFAVVRDLGLRRLNDKEIVQTGAQVRAHIRRTARKGTRTILCADYEKLDRPTQVQHNVELSMLGALELVAGEKAAKRIEPKVREAGGELPGALAAALALKDVR